MVLTNKQLKNFWNKVDKTSKCWDWTGYTLNGYGKVNLNAKVYNAHRISLIISGSKILPSKSELGASGEVIMHSCDNRKCVNPKHLKLTTQKENLADALAKGRRVLPDWSNSKNPKAKLSNRDVKEIRKSTKKPTELSLLYKVDKSQIYNIINNKSWVLAK